MPQKPAFVSFTGADSLDGLEDMRRLSRHYPLEWGLLLDAEKAGSPLFPAAEVLDAFLTTPGLRYAAHVCGEQAKLIANQPHKATIDLAGFQRLQVNHGFSGSSERQVENCVRFGRMRGVRTMLQTIGGFPPDARLDWLFDTSFGTGKAPDAWPAFSSNGPFCGYSGGINPDNVEAVLHSINAPTGGQYWIDMESGIRTKGKFDLAKCELICKAVFG